MKIYSFIRDNKKSAIHIEPIADFGDDDLIRNPSSLLKNNKFEITKGKKTFDALSFTYSLDFVFSENVKSLFEKNNITGIIFYPIIINKLNIPYYGFYVTGKGGKVTNLDEKGRIPESAEYNMDDWDGSDIFCVEKSGAPYMTENVKILLEKNNITNLRFSEGI